MNEPKVEIVKRTTPLNSAIAEIGKQIHDASSEPKVDQRHREAAQNEDRTELLRNRIKELQASIGAIHYHSKFGTRSEAQYTAILHSIKEECERCIPELRNMKINAEMSHTRKPEDRP